MQVFIGLAPNVDYRTELVGIKQYRGLYHKTLRTCNLQQIIYLANVFLSLVTSTLMHYLTTESVNYESVVFYSTGPRV